MATVRKTITLTEHQDSWVKAQISTGLYKDDSECIRDLISKEQERADEFEAIRGALVDGENSGPGRKFDVDAFKKRMMNANG